MANIETLKNALNKNELSTGQDLASLVKRIDVVKRFEEVLGKKTPAFIASLLSLHNASPQLQKCNPRSILSSAMIAATLDLPINPSLGFAAIVPYKDQAQFQIMVKGLIQLAIRTGLYQSINASEVYEGELVEWNRVKGTFEIDEAQKKSDKVIGYVAHFKLLTGFEKFLYMTVDQIEAHARKFSKSFGNPNGPWKQFRDAMMTKTPLKLLISKFGPLSVEIQRGGIPVIENGLEKAMEFDQAVVVEAQTGDLKPEYPDNPQSDLPTDALDPVEGPDLPLK